MPKINTMRALGVICLIIIIITSYISFIAYQVRNISQSVLRLHIIANSDSEYDQSLKLDVRDGIIKSCGYLFKDCESVEDAERTARENIGLIESTAAEIIAKNGYGYSVECYVGEYAFPTKTYGGRTSVTLPKGRYNALNIKIGGAAGQNWWCVMYPPLCFVDGVIEASGDTLDILKSELSESELKLISSTESPPVRLKLKIAELIGF